MDSIIPVWCHICSAEREGVLNNVTQEYNCNVCLSECVEEVSQGVELFNSPSSATNQTQSQTDEVHTIDDNLSQLMSRAILSPTSSPSTTRHIIPAQNGRPAVGVVVHQSFISTSQLGGSTLIGSDRIGIPISNVFPPSSNRGLSGLINALNAPHQLGRISDSDLLDTGTSESNAFADLLHHILMNESSHAGAPPASQAVIASLRSEEVTAETDVAALGECNISQESFEVGDVVVTLACEHKYKRENIVHWLEMHNTCPVCRIVIK